jgi:hypothetical protein
MSSIVRQRVGFVISRGFCPFTLALLLCGAPLAAQTPGFTSFDAPHAGTLFNTGTFVAKINASGMIAGYYRDTSENSHGFIRKPNGNFTEFDVPGLYDVTVTSMNNSGQVVGWGGHVTGSGTWAHGFLRFADGTTVEINVSGAVSTSPTAINDGGVVAGSYFDSKGDHGFVRDAQGNYTLFDDPEVVTGREERGTFVTGIQSNGTVVGYYTGKTGTGHGYIRDQFGNFTNFDAPDAGNGFLIGTFPRAINELGEVTGSYVDIMGEPHGFVRDAQGTLTEFDPPDADDSSAFSSNNFGKTVGLWGGGQGSGGGFVRDSSGAVTTFSVPLRNTGTYPFDINDAGQITGSWVDAGQRAWHGFVQVN